MSEKNWGGQPDCVVDADVMCVFYMKGPDAIIEVRRCREPEQGYIVTTGNLFGSQTIKANTADAVFKMMDALSKYSESEDEDERSMALPDGCSIISEDA